VSFMALCLVCAGTLAVVIPICVEVRMLRLVRTELDDETADRAVHTNVRRIGCAAYDEAQRERSRSTVQLLISGFGTFSRAFSEIYTGNCDNFRHMARRGFFAELHRMGVQVERENRRLIREAERYQKAQERADAQTARSNAADRKRAEKEADEEHVAAMEAEVESKNAQLSEMYDEVDSILAATLDVDDFVDLNTLRKKLVHPPFDRVDLLQPAKLPAPGIEPAEPVIPMPPSPSGFAAIFGKKKYARAVEVAKEQQAQATSAWRSHLEKLRVFHQKATEAHGRAEAQRQIDLINEQERYARECTQREKEVAEHNAAIDTFIANLGYGSVDAVQEYVSIVMSNSVYPDHFRVRHDFSFDATTAELRLRVAMPPPDTMPTVKAYKYTKSSDEITEIADTQKSSRDRYAGAVNQVALRSLHEVFEADRRGIIKTIALEVGTETIDPATGNLTYILFVATGAVRDVFMTFDLANVVPSATLERLGAAVSKNPFGLVAANAAGIRRS
jgi:restriction system protein